MISFIDDLLIPLTNTVNLHNRDCRVCKSTILKELKNRGYEVYEADGGWASWEHKVSRKRFSGSDHRLTTDLKFFDEHDWSIDKDFGKSKHVLELLLKLNDQVQSKYTSLGAVVMDSSKSPDELVDKIVRMIVISD